MPHVYNFLSSDEPLKPEISVMKVMIEAELHDVNERKKQTSLVLARQACMFELLFTIFHVRKMEENKMLFLLK